MRQLTGESAEVRLVRSYAPYGQGSYTAGAGATSYGFTGEWTDGFSGLVYLRARWYAPRQGRFLTRDSWEGDHTRPLSLNHWMYVEGNPINRVDPSGQCYGPASFLRNVPVEREICGQLDQALYVYTWKGSTTSQRSMAGAYIGSWAFAHSALIVGVSGLAVAGGEAAVVWLIAQYRLSPTLQQAAHRCLSVSERFIKPFRKDGIAASCTNAVCPDKVNIVYRALAQGEDPSVGLWARDLGGVNTPVSHIAGKRASQWISTTRDINVAQYFNRYGIVEINLSKIPNHIVDYSNGIPGMNHTMLSNWAKKFQEVLVQHYIPPSAIIRVIKGQ